MITDITIGQYFPGDSVVHKMDSRMKIILTVLLIVAIFICKTLPALGVIVVATIALVLISKIPLKTVFKSKTPSFVHLVKSPLFGSLKPKSADNSLKIFLSDGGNFTPAGTEKLNPCACPLS